MLDWNIYNFQTHDYIQDHMLHVNAVILILLNTNIEEMEMERKEQGHQQQDVQKEKQQQKQQRRRRKWDEKGFWLLRERWVCR